MNNKQIQKPLIVELEDAKNEFMQFVQDLQNRGLPCYLIELALSPIITQVHNIARAELEAARQTGENKN